MSRQRVRRVDSGYRTDGRVGRSVRRHGIAEVYQHTTAHLLMNRRQRRADAASLAQVLRLGHELDRQMAVAS